jgi:hypothetical protein
MASAPVPSVVVGLDVGGTKTNATILDQHGAFLLDTMMEVPSNVRQGPPAALKAISDVLSLALQTVGLEHEAGLSRRRARPTSPSRPGGDSTFEPRWSSTSNCR